MKPIEKVGVLGAGTMGARIAAHLANAGVPCFLLDMVPSGANGDRNSITAAGLEAAKKSKPAAFFDRSLASLVTVGNFDDNLDWLPQCDWVIEAVVEDLEIKRALLKKVEAVRRPGTIITTNTSGLPVASIVEGFSEDFRRSWFGTHFFNPPRYMRLVEVIATSEADRAAVDAIARFCDLRLGKGIVFAKDTPNFIANRIGTFSMLNVIRLMQQMDFSVEEVDALTGSPIGWPNSATFRMIDVVGLDVLGQVVRNMTRNVRDECSDLKLPEFMHAMLERKWLGDKTGGGFYKKIKTAKGDERLALNWKTLEYRPQQKPNFAAVEMTKSLEFTAARVQALLRCNNGGPTKADRAGRFVWNVLTDIWAYAANRIGEISESIVEIDRAMRLGFNWDLGPFELWDAAGVEFTVEHMKREGKAIAPSVERLLAEDKTSWYTEAPTAPSVRAYFDVTSAAYVNEPTVPGVGSVAIAKKAHGVVAHNAGASLVDLGDGVGCIEFHSKLNVMGEDTIRFTIRTLASGGLGDHFDAFVITNDAANFSAGADLKLLLRAIQEQRFDEIHEMIRVFQQMTQAIKLSVKPVVVAPSGMTLGGGCEVAVHGAARQPHAELYMGFTEAGVGLLPAGGGCKEMLLRALEASAHLPLERRAGSIEFAEAIKRAFETIALAKVSTSAEEARSLGLLSSSDRVTMNRERVLADAKSRVLEMARAGYRPPLPRTDIPASGSGMLAALKLGLHIMRQGEFISDHDLTVATRIAEVLCGGAVTPGAHVSEQYILDLELEGFKSLCGERKTQERIHHTLTTGKLLRN